jgi:hypothetical protein
MKDQDKFMKGQETQTSDALNEILKVINAKGDERELREIVNQDHEQSLLCSDQLFDNQLRVIVDDTVRGDE